MTLHLVEIPVSLNALNRWAGRRQFSSAFDEGVALHHLLGESFGAAVLQPFRLMVAPRAHSGSLYGYAREDANTLSARAQAYLTPEIAEVLNLAEMRSLPRPETMWTQGQRIGFDVKLRPVVRLASPLQGSTAEGEEVSLSKGAETDAFLAAVLRGANVGRDAVYLDWLAKRLEAVAELDQNASRLASFQRVRIQRKGRWIEGPDAIVHGTMTITDPAAFAALLARGVGRHLTYGYGMLLLRPPQRAAPC